MVFDGKIGMRKFGSAAHLLVRFACAVKGAYSSISL